MSVRISTVEGGVRVLADFESRPFFLVSLRLESTLRHMAQLQLPVFPNGVTQLSSDLGVSCREGKVSYFYGTLPVFTHDAKDTKSFRMFLSQLYLEGKIKQAEAVRVFGISAISLKGEIQCKQNPEKRVTPALRRAVHNQQQPMIVRRSEFGPGLLPRALPASRLLYLLGGHDAAAQPRRQRDL